MKKKKVVINSTNFKFKVDLFSKEINVLE